MSLWLAVFNDVCHAPLLLVMHGKLLDKPRMQLKPAR